MRQHRPPPTRLRVGIAIGTAAAAIVAGLLATTTSASAATDTLAPVSLTTSAGAVGSGQTYSNLILKDQTGTANNYAKYVEFSPSGGNPYSGYRTYTLPGSVVPATVTAVQVSANYKGPSTADQTWTWALYNWSTSTWSNVGTNATAPSWGSWKLLSFASPASASSFVSSTGSIRVRLLANNTSDSADVDFESVVVTSSASSDTTAPSTPAGLTVTGTTSSSASLSWTASTDDVAVTGYEVFQNGGATPVASPTGTSVTVPGLGSSTAYSFTVKARDAAGNRSAASSAVIATTTAGGGGSGYTLPPADGQFDYQLGGAYTPVAAVQVVSRDRLQSPAVGKYNVCYVNLLQTQPDEEGQSTTDPPYGTTAWWIMNHPDLLVTVNGEIVIDPDWNEAIFDVSTVAKRTALAEIQKPWIQACRTAGFDAVEPDNLDSYDRSQGVLTFANDRDYLKLIVPYAHSVGLAIGQKNVNGEFGSTGKTFVDTVTPAQGFDFAIAEECQAYTECDDYTNVYGGRVYEIEYTDNNPNQTRSGVTKKAYAWACIDRGATNSAILRDRDVLPSGTTGYHYEAC